MASERVNILGTGRKGREQCDSRSLLEDLGRLPWAEIIERGSHDHIVRGQGVDVLDMRGVLLHLLLVHDGRDWSKGLYDFGVDACGVHGETCTSSGECGGGRQPQVGRSPLWPTGPRAGATWKSTVGVVSACQDITTG
jgi:hypothetical protein